MLRVHHICITHTYTHISYVCLYAYVQYTLHMYINKYFIYMSYIPKDVSLHLYMSYAYIYMYI